jgi:hypothetical protein
MRARGVAAVPSYTVFPESGVPQKEEIIALLEAGFEWVGQDGGLTYFKKRK